MRLKVIRNPCGQHGVGVRIKRIEIMVGGTTYGDGCHEKGGHEYLGRMMSEETKAQYSKDGEGQRQSKEVY